MDYESTLAYISSFGRFGSRPGLERMQWMLSRMGHPEAAQRFIHVGGTNGKGSTTALIHNILQAAGYSVGMYTSPYLESFTNRIGAAGADIKQEHLVDLVERLRPLFEELNETELGPITQFEVTTLLALAYYQQLDLDLVVWEVGLGGRLDATNVVNPLVSVVTNIGLDHTEVLGTSLPEIAMEKAGIIKPAIPVVTAIEDEAAFKALQTVAEAVGAPIWRLGAEFAYQRTSFDLQQQRFTYSDLDGEWHDLVIRLMGEHQCKNAATALAVISQLRRQGFCISEQACREGLIKTVWPGRLEVMQAKPLIIVDGAHNPHGTKALEQVLVEYFPDKKITMVLGILQDKVRQEMLGHLLPHADRVIFAAPDFGRAIDPELLLLDAADYQVKATVAASVAQAVDAALSTLTDLDVLLIAGSLYTVSEAREHLKQTIS